MWYTSYKRLRNYKEVFIMKIRFILCFTLVFTILFSCGTITYPVLAEEPSRTISTSRHQLFDYIYTPTDCGLETNTLNGHNYQGDFATIPTTHLQTKEDGGYIRTEYNNGKVYVQEFDENFTWLPDMSFTVTVALPTFGGIYYGEQYTYILSGNAEEDPIGKIALQQYDKNWNFLKKAVYEDGANLRKTIDSGSSSFAERGNLLYVYTCTRQPNKGDGVEHQGNLGFVVEQDTLTITLDRYFGVSQSFNQFAVSDGETLYTLDHGTAYPYRGFMINHKKWDGLDQPASGRTVTFHCGGEIGKKDTGETIGAFDLMDDRLITVISTINQNLYPHGSHRQKNVMLFSFSKDFSHYVETYLTNYNHFLTKGDEGFIVVGNPHLVPIDQETAYVMWEEQEAGTLHRIRILKVDNYGNRLGETHSIYGWLSAFRPLITDGNLVWYVTGQYGHTDPTSPVFYKVNLNRLEAGEYDCLHIGDLNADGKINANDVLLILKAAVNKITLTQEQKEVADLNKDTNIDAKDALEILKFLKGKPSALTKQSLVLQQNRS